MNRFNQVVRGCKNGVHSVVCTGVASHVLTRSISNRFSASIPMITSVFVRHAHGMSSSAEALASVSSSSSSSLSSASAGSSSSSSSLQRSLDSLHHISSAATPLPPLTPPTPLSTTTPLTAPSSSRSAATSPIPAVTAAPSRDASMLDFPDHVNNKNTSNNPNKRRQQQPAVISSSVLSRRVEDALTSAQQPLRDIPAVKGRIHSVETGTCVDGEGLRYLVFLQGCNRRCVFCANPDTWKMNGGKEMNSKDIASRVKRYIPYLNVNGGGVTVSGGEPLLQPDFVKAIFEETHALGLTTTLDTSVAGRASDWHRVLPHVDTVLCCIKGLHPKTYQTMANSPGDSVLPFVRLALRYGCRLWIRWVLVPGYTDTEAELSALTTLATSLRKQYPDHFRGVELLPYHTLGVHKWKTLQLPYALDGVKAASRPVIEQTKRKILGLNIPVKC